MVAPASEPRLASDRHDAVLALALGSLSVARQFEELVSRVSTPAGQPLDDDDPVILAALGVLSLGRSLQRWLEEAAAPIRQPDAGASAADAPTLGELLR